MFGPTSRYYTLETSTHIGADGKHASFKKRRFLPNGQSMPILVEVKLKQGERLDLITARSLGDPEQFWRICDAIIPITRKN